MSTQAPSSARESAVRALIDAARLFPDRLEPTSPDTRSLSPADASLALALHRTVLQRWWTLEYVLDRFLSQPCAKLEPAMRAVLLGGAAQLLFMQRLPAYAVVNEQVALAKQLVRPKARGMVNAVLRKAAALVQGVEEGAAWRPAPDALPMDGGVLRLREACLPDPDEDWAAHVAVATSHPRWLVERWVAAMGREAASGVCAHGVVVPPTVVAVEPGFDEASADWAAHELTGFVVWRGSHDALKRFLEAHPHRRVQDPASHRAVAACADMKLASALDYCAGRGTKTVQLAVEHPDAHIHASDPDTDRFASLQQVAQRFVNVTALSPDAARQQQVDLLLLDVPCSNSGVLARRPEARYRMNAKRQSQLVTLQRQIIERALPTVRAGGAVLYSTCSLEPEENREQARWLVEMSGGELVREATLRPAGRGTSYHDGSYHALVRLP